MVESLHINQRDEGGITVIDLAGSLDGHTFPQLEQYLNGRMVEPAFTTAVLDLHRLGYVSSAGIGVMISTQQQLRERGGDLLLVAPAPIVREVFSILGLHALFTIHDDLAAARTALDGGS